MGKRVSYAWQPLRDMSVHNLNTTSVGFRLNGLLDEGDPRYEVLGTEKYEEPVFDYHYPIELPYWTDEEEAAEILRPQCMCLIRVDDNEPGITEGHYLSLTGGGMDMSWHICWAYLSLGAIPPLYYGLSLQWGSDLYVRRTQRVVQAVRYGARWQRRRLADNAQRLMKRFEEAEARRRS